MIRKTDLRGILGCPSPSHRLALCQGRALTVTSALEWRGVMQHKDKSVPQPWGVAEAIDMYGIREWGNNYFGISDAGHVLVTPQGPAGPTIDLELLVKEVRQRGVGLPLLLRFA